ncbi:MAG: DUF1573 domain-containing protein [Deltaproteobacteria bacterium]|nr:DUF1573 domain-containing protein [Deltaproteobacteria bacterium]TLN01148.1 MAG: DUF1573 domain-containing protein [bacterium]
MKTGISLTTILAAVLSLAVPAMAGPQLTFDKNVFDFHSVVQGKTVSHSFTFRNTGDAPATITRVSSSCGCTVANVSDKVIPPGKSGAIKAAFDSSDFYGPVSKDVFVYLGDQQKPAYILSMKGLVVEELVITPRQINLGSVKAGVRKEVTVVMENKGNKTVKITSLKTELPQTTISSGKKTLKPGEKTSIKITVIPRTDNRFVNGYLTISTNSQGKVEKTVPIFGVLAK